MVNKAPLWKRVIASFYIWLLLLLMYLPVLVLIVFSFTDSLTLGTWTGFTFQLYADLFQNEEIMTAVGNTLLLALISAILATLIGTLGAIGVHECKSLSKKAMEFGTNIPIVNPEIVIALSLVITFVFIGSLFGGYQSSFWTLLIGHLVLTTPFVYLSVRPKLLQLDPSLYEAALDLGCKPRQALWKVTFPEIMPGMLSGFLLAFTLSLDDFEITAFTAGPGLLSGNASIKTISTYVQGIIKKHPMPPELRALTTIIFGFALLLVVGVTLYNSHAAKHVKKRKGRVY